MQPISQGNVRGKTGKLQETKGDGDGYGCRLRECECKTGRGAETENKEAEGINELVCVLYSVRRAFQRRGGQGRRIMPGRMGPGR